MCNHYLVDPVACTPASGWEKGQVENQVGLVRERFFTPRLRFKSYDELNAWLTDKCIAYAKVHRHPDLTEQTIWEVFETERPQLVACAGRRRRQSADGRHPHRGAYRRTAGSRGLKQSDRASIPPTSFSTSWPVLGRRKRRLTSMDASFKIARALRLSTHRQLRRYRITAAKLASGR
jgi:hypothetical protein